MNRKYMLKLKVQHLVTNSSPISSKASVQPPESLKNILQVKPHSTVVYKMGPSQCNLLLSKFLIFEKYVFAE